MSNTNKCKTENTVREKVQGGITLEIEVLQGKCNRTMGQVLRALPKERFMRCPEVEKMEIEAGLSSEKRKQWEHLWNDASSIGLQ